MNLSPDQRQKLQKLTKVGSTNVRIITRARILLLLDEKWAPVDIPEALGCGDATVRRIRRRYEEEGLESALAERPRPGAKSLLSEKEAALIVAMVCSDPPIGRARWSLRLIAEEAIKRRLVKTIGRETVRVLLRSHDLKPWREKNVVRTKTQWRIH